LATEVGRPIATTEHASVCPLDCPDTCSLTVTVENAKIVKIRGSRANPYTAGVICAKVAGSYPDWVHGPGRLQTPLRRVGAKGEGRFERVSWDQALDIVHERVTAVIAAHGPQAVAPLNYAGPHGMLAYASMDLRFFNRLGASLLERSALCGGIRTQAWLGTFGTTPGIAPEQVRHSRLIIAWGNVRGDLPRSQSPANTRTASSVRSNRTKRGPRHLELPRGLIDVVATAEMQPSRERRERMRRFAEGHVSPVEPDLAVGHVDADAAIRLSERVVGKVKIDWLELSQCAHGLSLK